MVAVSEFDFVSYLEESGQEAVPEGAFAHVDASGKTSQSFISSTNISYLSLLSIFPVQNIFQDIFDGISYGQSMILLVIVCFPLKPETQPRINCFNSRQRSAGGNGGRNPHRQ